VSRLAIVEIQKEELKFSAGHFMVFSGSKRETMHGHDYQVSVAFECAIVTNGMSFDCRYYKEKLQALCQKLDYHFLLPSQSDFLRLEELDDRWLAHMEHESIPFLKNDVVVLPITNVTVEELSYWFLQQLTIDFAELTFHNIHTVSVKIFNGRGDAGACKWEAATHQNMNYTLDINALSLI
jgi:6-pyruvoyltetrahydropterin/6-carboxytetrahydropterin synthase